MSSDESPPEGFEAPWLIIARAGGPHGESEHLEARMHKCPGEPDAEKLAEVRKSIIKTYRGVFDEEPARVGVGALPWYAEADEPDG